MTPLELIENDLEVAEASVRFALENCPVEGVLSREDGTPVSLDGLQEKPVNEFKMRPHSTAMWCINLIR